jgi:hypothetical protein
MLQNGKKCLLQTHAWNVILDLFTNCPELFAGKGDKRREKYRMKDFKRSEI